MTDFKGIFKRFSKASHPLPAKLSSTEAFKAKYHAFQRLLEKNNHVLEIMADMEEKLSGEYLFDRHYIDANVRAISDGVLKITEHLNAISKDKYRQLYKSYAEINEEIKNMLARKLEIPVSGFTIPIENLTKEMPQIAGGKIAHLGEIKNRLSLLTPDGFSITAYAFKRFMEHNNFREKINEKLSSVHIENMDELNKVSKEIQEMVIQAEIPEDLEKAIIKAVEKVKHSCHPELDSGSYEMLKPVQHDKQPFNPLTLQPFNLSTFQPFNFSVRSSAIQEDSEFSFAGQYATFLNVPANLVLQRYKEVVASLFTQRAIFYYKTKGFSGEEMVMAVGILKMIDAKAGGVIYTRDPNDPEKYVFIINAVWGLGKSVVDGTVEPNSYIVSRDAMAIIEKKVPEQQTMFVCAREGDIREVNVSDEIKSKPCLTDEQIKILAEYASMLENHYGNPQDIEWAIDQSNDIYMLQTRPLRTFNVQRSTFNIPLRIEGYNILLDKGVIACKGVGYGKAFILKGEEGLKDFPEGAVLVARHTSTKFVTIMNKASAIVTDVGGATGHMALLSREYQIPTILDVEKATSVIKDGQEITVDAINCNIYEGRVEELITSPFTVHRSPFKDTHLFIALEKALKFIVPLNLIDPEAENFSPESCRTFHDITRFAHEMAMTEMFGIGIGHEIKDSWTIPLSAGIPMYAHMIDIDGGIREGIKRATPADIMSIPFSAFLKGMTGMRWPDPRAADVKGIIGMMAHTATIPEEELYSTGKKSFAVISENYMNFSIRLGYHFSQVEAYAGENINDNYIKFFFKGGGASIDRRLRRVRFITEILKKLDLRVKVTGDVIDAMLNKYRQSTIEEKLEVMGKLTAYTKQLDMVMYNDAVTDMFIEDFVKEHLKQKVER